MPTTRYAKKVIQDFTVGGMLCQVICRASILGIVYLLQTTQTDFKWIIPLIFGFMGTISSFVVYSLPDKSTSSLADTKTRDVKQADSVQ